MYYKEYDGENIIKNVVSEEKNVVKDTKNFEEKDNEPIKEETNVKNKHF